MPELPEVHTILNDLAPRLQGLVFQEVTQCRPGTLNEPSTDELARSLPGKRIEQLERRGKYLLLHLDSGQTLIFHLGMTGRLYLLGQAEPPDPYCTANFVLDDSSQLCFADPRKFGHIWLVDDAASVVGKLGPDALDESVGASELQDMLSLRRGTRIKAVLLDQSVLAGIGNIYADEALFEARINAERAAGSLTPEEVAELRRAILVVLRRGIENRGTTFSDYRDGFGRAGMNQQALAVFHRTGKPCPRCGTAIKRKSVAGRGTHYCPSCQPL